MLAGAGLGCAVFNADETYRALAEFDGEVAMAVGGAEARERLYVPLAEARALLAGSLQIDVVQRDQPVQFNASRPQFAARDISGAERDLMRLVNDGYRVFVVFRHAGEAERATYRLRNLSAEVVSRSSLPAAARPAAGLYFLAAPLRDGFVSAELRLAVVNERALLRAAPREQRFAGGTRLASFFDVRPDDYVVHEDHGIARFAGIETRTVAGITRDYLLLEFKGEDRVFVPHDQIGKVSRYIGASGASPTLDKLGGTIWFSDISSVSLKSSDSAANSLRMKYAMAVTASLRRRRRCRREMPIVVLTSRDAATVEIVLENELAQANLRRRVAGERRFHARNSASAAFSVPSAREIARASGTSTNLRRPANAMQQIANRSLRFARWTSERSACAPGSGRDVMCG